MLFRSPVVASRNSPAFSQLAPCEHVVQVNDWRRAATLWQASKGSVSGNDQGNTHNVGCPLGDPTQTAQSPGLESLSPQVPGFLHRDFHLHHKFRLRRVIDEVGRPGTQWYSDMASSSFPRVSPSSASKYSNSSSGESSSPRVSLISRRSRESREGIGDS